MEQSKELVHSITVPCGETYNGTVYYTLDVQGTRTRWTVKKRYTQLENLHIDLIQLFLDDANLPELPPKKLKLFQSHTSPKFIQERQQLISTYLQRLVHTPKLAKSKRFHDFITTDRVQTQPILPATSNQNTHIAQNVHHQSMATRSQPVA